MVPLGLSMALTVRMGEAWGAAQYARLRFILVSGWGFALAFTACSALGFLFFNHTIAGWFLTEPKAAALTASLLLISAAFQVSDAMQVSSRRCLARPGRRQGPGLGRLCGLLDHRNPCRLAPGLSAGMGVAGMWWGIYPWPNDDSARPRVAGLKRARVLSLPLWRKWIPDELELRLEPGVVIPQLRRHDVFVADFRRNPG